MKYGQVETEKMYFSSGEAAKLVGVPVSVLHSWEKEFSVLNPKKNRAGKRIYSQSDIETAKEIKNKANFETTKEPRKKPAKSKPASKPIKSKLEMDKDFLLKIRSNLQNALNKIKK
jgi:DNA-binding transcriptional MerR regulator